MCLCAGVETTRLHVLGLLRDCLANVPTQVHVHELCVPLTGWASLGGPLWFWQCVMSLLVVQHLKLLCEGILKTMALGSTVSDPDPAHFWWDLMTVSIVSPPVQLLRTTCLHALHGLMSSLAGPQGLTVDLTARITTVSQCLLSASEACESCSLPPPPSPRLYTTTSPAWPTPSYCKLGSLSCLQPTPNWPGGTSCLTVAQHEASVPHPACSLDRGLCVGHLVRLFSVGVACLLSHKTDVTHTAASAMQVSSSHSMPAGGTISPLPLSLTLSLRHCYVRLWDRMWLHWTRNLLQRTKQNCKHCRRYTRECQQQTCPMTS